jgi:hypothetical protein
MYNICYRYYSFVFFSGTGICISEFNVVLFYRCESGQEAVLAYCDTKSFFGSVHHHHSGDFDVMRQSRRLELALMQNGWQGNVEEWITKEMRNETLDEKYLQTSQFLFKK